MIDEDCEGQTELRVAFQQTPARRRRALRERQTREFFGLLAITPDKPARYIVQRPSQAFEEWHRDELSDRFEWEMLP